MSQTVCKHGDGGGCSGHVIGACLVSQRVATLIDHCCSSTEAAETVCLPPSSPNVGLPARTSTGGRAQQQQQQEQRDKDLRDMARSKGREGDREVAL